MDRRGPKFEKMGKKTRNRKGIGVRESPVSGILKKPHKKRTIRKNKTTIGTLVPNSQ